MESRSTVEVIRMLTRVGVALSSEKNHGRLMELILKSAKELTRADGGTIYSRTDDDHLRFEIMLTDSLDLALGGTSGRPIELPPLPLFDDDGHPNDHMVAVRAVSSGATVNVPDAYDAPGFDFSGTRDFDRRTGYRSRSFLTVPMRNHEEEIIGVLQLINARRPSSGAVVAFTEEDQQLVECLASEAAITLTKERLIADHRRLFEAFVELIAIAIDDKSPYTGNHCRRVPILTMMLAEAVANASEGPLAGFTMDDDGRYELKIAAWLHDCGKVTTPEAVIDKATKLQGIFDRIQLVDARFEIVQRDAEIARLRAELKARCPEDASPEDASPEDASAGETFDAAAADADLQSLHATLQADRDFLHEANKGAEFMSTERQQRVREIGARRWSSDLAGEERTLLSASEIENLTVQRGTLTADERGIIKNHAVTSIKMLESLPYPKNLTRVPEFAGGHHERMDGKGYPRGLRREQMSIQARIMGIADIFEALTAGDRPYKKAMTLSQALTILGQLKLDQHIDPDLFDVFVRERVYEKYARQFLKPEQIDEVDLSVVPGVPEDAVLPRSPQGDGPDGSDER